MLKSITSLLLASVLLTVVLAAEVRADPKACVFFLRNGLYNSIHKRNPDLTRLRLRQEICKTSARGSFKRGRVSLFNGALKARRRQFTAAQKLLCKRTRPARRYRSLIKKLGRLVQRRSAKNYKSCLNMQRRGLTVKASISEGLTQLVNLDIIKDENDPPLTGTETLRSLTGTGTLRSRGGSPQPAVQQTTLTPSQQFFTAGSIFGSLKAQPPFTTQQLQGALLRKANSGNSWATLSIQTNVGKVSLIIPPASRLRLAAFPFDVVSISSNQGIEGCSNYQGDPSVQLCVGTEAYHPCVMELVDGSYSDCRSVPVPFLSFPGSPYSEYQPAAGDYHLHLSSTAQVTVTRGWRGAGTVSGSASYTYLVDTPTLQATNCDSSVPIAGPNPCSRDCIDAFERTDFITGHLGALHTRSVGMVGCNDDSRLTGTMVPDDVDLYRAYDLCEAQNAWGSRTVGTATREVAKVFLFSNPTTTRIEITPLQIGWTYENIPEFVRAYRVLDINFDINCNEL